MLETINILLTMFNMCNVHLQDADPNNQTKPNQVVKFRVLHRLTKLSFFEATKQRSANQRYQVMSYRLRLLNRAYHWLKSA